jgi:hypothetical protein
MLPEDLKTKVVREAHSRGVSLGEYVREALVMALRDRPAEASGDSLYADHASFSGPAPKDASQRHDAHLYGGQK